MKKVPLFLCCTAIVLLIFTVGFFLFRNHGGGMIRILPYLSPAESTAPTEPISYPIDINTADVAALMTLPGIGQTYAQHIVDYRTEHGDFTALTDLLNVEGIGQKRLEAILEYITIGGSDEDTGC